jgi:hypothetical protein
MVVDDEISLKQTIIEEMTAPQEHLWTMCAITDLPRHRDAARGAKKNRRKPMPSEHAKISYLKSGIRIAGYACLFFVGHHPAIFFAVAWLIGAEVLGIVEEFGH